MHATRGSDPACDLSRPEQHVPSGMRHQQSGLSRRWLLPLQKAPNAQPSRCFRSCGFAHQGGKVAILEVSLKGIVSLPVWA